jgi:16S rRNA G966 N2-methylase RsmD
VRETLFNWLGQDLVGWQVFDAFAGTGALGLEAASRGAARVTLVEQDAAQARDLQAVVQRLPGAAAVVQVARASGIAVLQRQAPASLDLVLLDPPFDADLYRTALVAALPALRTGGWLYLEASAAWTAADGAPGTPDADPADPAHRVPPGLALRRHLRAGAVHAHLFEDGHQISSMRNRWANEIPEVLPAIAHICHGMYNRGFYNNSLTCM